MEPGTLVIGAAGLVLAALLALLVTKRAARGDVPLNSAVGIRTRTTTASQQAWVVAHRAALPWVTGAASASVASAGLAVVTVLGASAGRQIGQLPAEVVLFLGYGALVVLLVAATSAGHRAVRRADLL